MDDHRLTFFYFEIISHFHITRVVQKAQHVGFWGGMGMLTCFRFLSAGRLFWDGFSSQLCHLSVVSAHPLPSPSCIVSSGYRKPQKAGVRTKWNNNISRILLWHLVLVWLLFDESESCHLKPSWPLNHSNIFPPSYLVITPDVPKINVYFGVTLEWSVWTLLVCRPEPNVWISKRWEHCPHSI